MLKRRSFLKGLLALPVIGLVKPTLASGGFVKPVTKTLVGEESSDFLLIRHNACDVGRITCDANGTVYHTTSDSRLMESINCEFPEMLKHFKMKENK